MAFLFNFQCKYTIILDKDNIERNNFVSNLPLLLLWKSVKCKSDSSIRILLVQKASLGMTRVFCGQFPSPTFAAIVAFDVRRVRRALCTVAN